MPKILVTGGLGYIGSHTIIELLNSGYEVVSIDNNSRSEPWIEQQIKNISGKDFVNHKVDLCNLEALKAVFELHDDFDGVIHFAAYKAVGESTEKPLLYYKNNLEGLINILECVDIYKIPHFVFSSSCTVYGTPNTLPVDETFPIGNVESPYGATKLMGEQIISDFAKISKSNCVLLRYFNPVGAHESGTLGELPVGKPNNLVPFITQTAIGLQQELVVFGNDYDTIDGTCVRDYVHVSDIAIAHIKAFEWSLKQDLNHKTEVFNLGTGNGISVKQAIDAFENVVEIKLNYTFGERRSGDVVAIYADNKKAKSQLNWAPKRGINEMMQSAWKWQVYLKERI